MQLWMKPSTNGYLMKKKDVGNETFNGTIQIQAICASTSEYLFLRIRKVSGAEVVFSYD